jgi:phosphotransferase system  glucose/maltose/N-acetylglucosamine-specific IIC component
MNVGFDGAFAGLFIIVGLFGLVAFALLIWALIDCIQVPDDSMYRAGNKLIWVLVIIFVGIIGPILYFAIGRPSAETRRMGPPTLPQQPPG